MKFISIKTNKPTKKIGRGMGSGVGGHTTGRGGKGQTARGGHKSPRPGFEGGQNPISRRLPKLRGFSRGFAKSKVRTQILPLSAVDKFSAVLGDKVIDFDTLVAGGLIRTSFNKDTNFKILFDKDPQNKIRLKGVMVSQNVRQAIEKNGGTVE